MQCPFQSTVNADSSTTLSTSFYATGCKVNNNRKKKKTKENRKNASIEYSLDNLRTNESLLVYSILVFVLHVIADVDVVVVFSI